MTWTIPPLAEAATPRSTPVVQNTAKQWSSLRQPRAAARAHAAACLSSPSNTHNARLGRCTTFPWAPEELADDVNRTSIEASKWAGCAAHAGARSCSHRDHDGAVVRMRAVASWMAVVTFGVLIL